jgi:hypothetical protein
MVSSTLKNKENILSSNLNRFYLRIKSKNLNCVRPCRSTPHIYTLRRRARRINHPQPGKPTQELLLAAIKHQRQKQLSSLHAQKRTLVNNLPALLIRPSGSEDWKCSLAGNTDLEDIPIEYVRDQFAIHGTSYVVFLYQAVTQL